MNASYEWLRDFVPFALSPEELRDLLTSRVATVDDIVRLRADLDEIVVARVVEVERHPNADHLWVTKVDAGSGELRDVVCGAPNVTAGALYPFAAVGSTLPGGLKLEKRKIRGVVSEGMLCSARELDLGTDHEGIMALDVNVSPGTKFLDAVAVGDVRLVVDVLPNRPDLLSHEGLAREIAAAISVPLRVPAIPGHTDSPGPAVGRQPHATVMVEDVSGCPRYMAAIIRDVKIAPSPSWLAARVEAVGSRSINNVVDATNYMLHGFGQPMHAFDLSRLEGNRIVVRRARNGEKIRTLDGIERILDPEMTVIADGSSAQAIAGVIGGEGSEVTDATTDILLEVASFDARRVRATRRKLGVSSDASYRFERGVDAHACSRHLRYAIELITAVAGGTLDGDPADVCATLPIPPVIPVRSQRIETLLGEAIDSEEIDRELTSIGFSVATGKRDDGISVTPPTWRSDVVAEVEVIEEVARLHGYDKFSSEIRPFRPGSVPDAPLHLLSARVRNACVAAGLLEVRPLPFTRSNDKRSLKVRNPLAEDEAFLRQDILDTLARRAELNLAHMQRTIRLFEIGAVFLSNEAGKGALPDERIHLAILVLGDRRPPHFTEPRPPHYDEWDAKGIAESLGGAVFPGHVISCVPAEGDALWTITAADVKVGIVRPVPLDAPAWAAPAFGIEIDLEALSAWPGRMYSASPGAADRRSDGTVGKRSGDAGARAAPAVSAPARFYTPIPAMPAMDVDIALIVPDRIDAGQVERVIREAAGELLERLALFDEFRGAGVPEGSRSLAWRLTFRHPERTLREREIQGRTERIVKALEGELGVRQRTA
ncbi:MAG TPA: phenylalanine--tRNA ligase subunit beta [Gemmatimonadaceae bacterium]|nr:phenylalanine--tRNA ligase subunit beta [Gemmatimonadaceae bacterium]